MAPILEELRKEYAGRLDVVFIDVWKDRAAGKPYGISVIPTQIFYDASGKERFRHEGFFSKQEILRKFKEIGVDLTAGKSAAIVRETPVVVDSRPRAHACSLCDGAASPEYAGGVKDCEMQTCGCCTQCALGVAARLQQDIEVEGRDGLTGEPNRVQTPNVWVEALAPASATAWFGQKQGPDGRWVFAGCFQQGFFTRADNLQKWLDARPAMTGRQITLEQALADKMALSPAQIARAGKLGECT
jgi:thiol-disulfide isomerase/thioredoxin